MQAQSLAFGTLLIKEGVDFHAHIARLVLLD
jgi:hypothetical protein